MASTEEQGQDGMSTDRGSVSRSTNKLAKYGFRLSPAEQELAYELKARMFRKLEEQNARVNAELQMHQTVKDAQLRRSKSASAYQNQVEMSRANAIKLMRLYEKQAVKGQTRIAELEEELVEAQKIAKRYHDTYVTEKNNQSKSTEKNNQSKSTPRGQSPQGDSDKENQQTKNNGESDGKCDDRKKGGGRVTDDDLDDDEAVYKRHVLRVLDTKSMRDTAPIRVQDIIRKNEVLLVDNEKMRLEIKRLKWDNAQLIKKSKEAETEKNKVLHTIGTSEYARADLSKRLERERREHHKLQRSLTRQATEWVQIRKEMQEQDENRRWTTVTHLSPFDSELRTYQHPNKRNTDQPRQMYNYNR